MFYYTSFLRPPPTQAPLHQPIQVTPQVSNDLRTEVYTGERDLYYGWIPATPDTLASGILFQKLTTWRSTSAYKSIPVQPPKGVKEGQRWRLVLTNECKRGEQQRPEAVDLYSIKKLHEMGSAPFSVWSMPVLFTARSGKGSGMKQERVERLYILSACLSNLENPAAQIEMRLVEQTTFDLDKKVWDSGIGLSSWLCDIMHTQMEPHQPFVADLSKRLLKSDRLNIVELGAGIGIVSITLGMLLSMHPLDVQAKSERITILATDVESAMPLLKENIEANSDGVAAGSMMPVPLVLDWEVEELPEEVKSLEELDVIIMADVCYNTSSFQALVQTLGRLTKLSTPSSSPLILLGYKERDEAERTFWDLALQVAGLKFEKIGEKQGAGGNAVEIWLGRVDLKACS